MQYHVYGHCYKTDDTCLLHSAWTETEAVRWAKGYTKHGDMGGWSKIYVSRLEEVDIDEFRDVVLWSCWQEPMPWYEAGWSDNAMEEF